MIPYPKINIKPRNTMSTEASPLRLEIGATINETILPSLSVEYNGMGISFIKNSTLKSAKSTGSALHVVSSSLEKIECASNEVKEGRLIAENCSKCLGDLKADNVSIYNCTKIQSIIAKELLFLQDKEKVEVETVEITESLTSNGNVMIKRLICPPNFKPKGSACIEEIIEKNSETTQK